MTEDKKSPVVGRYAPSPTGDLHLGNLRTALIAWLHARLQGGRFLLRMEDLDTPRVVTGNADKILSDLEWLGLDWDGEVVYQSQRQDLYAGALATLQAQNLIYPCYCSRKDIAAAASAPHGQAVIYPGTCTNLSAEEQATKTKQPALRLRVEDRDIQFDDAVLGQQQENLQDRVGDFVVRRADGLFAYQLAVMVDDIEQGITDVVRGADLLSSTARQLYILDKIKPEYKINYCHVPLMLDSTGKRMAKRDGSDSVASWRAQNKNAEQLVGELAWSIGLVPTPQAVSVTELRDSLVFENLTKALR